MRHLASYLLETPVVPDFQGNSAQAVNKCIEDWLNSKGELSDDARTLRLRDGREATLDWNQIQTSAGSLTEWVLTEPTDGGRFRTGVNVLSTPEQVCVSARLSAGSETLAPLILDVHCPRVVRGLLGLPEPWGYKGSTLRATPIDLAGELGGDAFIDQVWSPARSIPIVVISDDDGAVLHPGIAEAIASDLAGLAMVVSLDGSASWRVTNRQGKEWSCYGGAIRLYWPGVREDSPPSRHPLWTPVRLLTGMPDTEESAKRLRRQLRRMILGQSAFAVTESQRFGEVRRVARDEELAQLRAKAEKAGDHATHAAELSVRLKAAEQRNLELELEREDLLAKVSSLQLALRYSPAAPDEIEPDEEVPPATVQEAVALARSRFSDTLTFGAAVDQGVLGLAPDAGPPDKVLAYLKTLADYTLARRNGSLGIFAIDWINKRGATASRESESILNSTRERRARTWDDGAGSSRLFELHLKPSDGTSPDRCVRIYFDYDEARRQTVVGWVGRHP